MTNHPNRGWRRRLLAEAEELGPDMVSAWLALKTVQHGWTLAEVAGMLAASFDRPGYDANRILKWRRGDESVPGPVAAVMRGDLLAALFKDDALAHALARLMEGPDRAG